ncbi:YidC/Oxa1 family membrane protein insertase [Streptomyces platensis]|uniref:YidC/Oxa1 family membrane protein insertase n=1 Tax=Streptomyces platensis TaxID=58346 RepID=UPI00225870C1|nr:YidC/Oxa1 family membrane protein insertase [Streptomyces platensis]MCX4634592.1 YidC/Oxa1 family membrane protein insertase [Streptomyces platensis]
MSMFGFLGDALAHGAQAIAPLFGPAAMAAAIVLFTLGVRAALHPLARAAARGEKARTALAPQLAELQRKHKGNPERLQKAMADLYAETGSSPLAGCLPTLLQLPVFFVMYHLFSTGGGDLLDHTLLGAPLGGHWTEALAHGGVLGPQGLVYAGLFVLVAAVATWNYRRARATMAKAPQPAGRGAAMPGMSSMAKVMPLLSFGTLITVAVVPLAAGLYMVTTTTWTACERALLHRERGRGRGAAEAGAVAAAVKGKAAAVKAAAVKGKAASTVGQPSTAAAAAPGSAAADEASGEGAPRQPAAQQRADRRTPKSRAARQRAARARANSRTRGTSGAGSRPADDAAPHSGGTAPDPLATTPR